MNGALLANRWLVSFRAVAAPRLRILCLPFAGGGANVYRPWADLVPQDVELLAARLPGRETRIAEKPATDISIIVDGLLDDLRDRADCPLALFGHSMGAGIAYDVAHRLTELGKMPAAIMVTGRPAPFLPRRRALVSTLPEPEFIEELKRMGGTPTEVFEHRELLDLVLPVVRADFQLSETLSRPLLRRFDCPLIAAAGEKDEDAPVQEVEAWRELAGSRFTFRVFPGGHFFIQDHRRQLVEMLLNEAR